MGAQPSSPKNGAHSFSAAQLRSLGLSTAAPFAPASQSFETPRKCKSSWSRSPFQAHGYSSNCGDLEAGTNDVEVGAPSSGRRSTMSGPTAQKLAESQPTMVVRVDSCDDPETTLTRQPSKMSVESVGSQSDSRPGSSRDFAPAHSNSCSSSRPASASSRLGAVRESLANAVAQQQAAGPLRSPNLVQAERLAKLSLEKLEQQDFIKSREAWGAGVSTPSTATPGMSRATSCQSSACGSRPASSAASVSSSIHSDPKAQLKEARDRAKMSFEALRSELKGSAAATPARYSAWPIGCPVKVACAGGSMDVSEPSGLLAVLVSYDPACNTFEVKLDDGSTRVVPAQQVTRARARDRAQSSTNVAGQAPGHQAPPLHPQQPQWPHQISEQLLQSEKRPPSSAAMLSPQTLGRPQLVV